MHTISIVGLAISLAPVGIVVWLANCWSGDGRHVLIASVRMLAQLLAVGYVLNFVLSSPNPVIGVVVVAVMIACAGMISIRTVSNNKHAVLPRAMAAIAVGAGAPLIFTYLFGLGFGLSYRPHIAIPLAGMVFSNAMTAVTLAAERIESEMRAGTEFDAARAAAFQAALIPQINALLAVGVVSLPGMMSGQILAGVDPLVAVRYQIVVMSLVLQSAAFSTGIFLTGKAMRA